MSDIATQERQKLPAPRKLSGREGLQDFMLDIRGKLAVDGNAIGGPINQFFYVAACLEGEAKALLRPYVAGVVEANAFAGQPQGLLRQVQAMLDNPHRRQQAGLRLVAGLRQAPSEKTSYYVARWEQLAYEAGANSWPDEAKILLLATGLKPATRRRLDSEEWAQGYDEFTRQLRGFDGVFDTGPGPDLGGGQQEETGDPMEIAVVSTNVQDGRCFYCGGKGHFRRNCPNRNRAGGQARTEGMPSTTGSQS